MWIVAASPVAGGSSGSWALTQGVTGIPFVKASDKERWRFLPKRNTVIADSLDRV